MNWFVVDGTKVCWTSLAGSLCYQTKQLKQKIKLPFSYEYLSSLIILPPVICDY